MLFLVVLILFSSQLVLAADKPSVIFSDSCWADTDTLYVEEPSIPSMYNKGQSMVVVSPVSVKNDFRRFSVSDVTLLYRQQENRVVILGREIRGTPRRLERKSVWSSEHRFWYDQYFFTTRYLRICPDCCNGEKNMLMDLMLVENPNSVITW